MMNKVLCPDCKKKVKRYGKDNRKIFCNKCKRDFKVIKGIPLMLPKRLSNFKKTEMNFFEKEFKKSEFGFVESDWNKNSFGLLDFMEVFKNLPKDAKILELGAGNGQYSLILNKKGFKNTTISDISIKGLVAAKKYSENKGSFIVLDSENIPFESGTFDVVFLTASLHHLPNPAKGIAEMKRCVRSGGLIIVAVEPNSWYYYIVRPIARILKIRKINKSKNSFSIGDEITHGFTLRRLKRYFKMQNIDIIKTQRVWYLTGIVYYLPELMKRIFNINLSISPKIRLTTLKIDRYITKIPLISSFSFHNTIVGVKR